MSPIFEEKLCFTVTMTGSYEAAAQVARKWGVCTDDSTIHAHVQQAGARAQALASERVERALEPASRQEVVAQAAQDLQGRKCSLVIEMDGWMVRERGEQWGLKPPEKQGDRVAWHEMKSAVIFRLDERVVSDSGRRELLDKSYVAWRGDAYEFGRRLYAEALRRGLHQAEKVYVVSDGAVWIWNLVADRFQTAVGVLDFYHASQHLWAVAQAIYPDPRQARRWVEPLLHDLKQGSSGRVLGRLEWLSRRSAHYEATTGERIEIEHRYFERHREHLDYTQAEQAGCPQGSGAIESTCSQFQTRFKRTGQFWSLAGETNLLALDLARRNDDWDEIWETAA